MGNRESMKNVSIGNNTQVFALGKDRIVRKLWQYCRQRALGPDISYEIGKKGYFISTIIK